MEQGPPQVGAGCPQPAHPAPPPRCSEHGRVRAPAFQIRLSAQAAAWSPVPESDALGMGSRGRGGSLKLPKLAVGAVLLPVTRTVASEQFTQENGRSTQP